MGKVIVTDTYLSNIASAIRGKAGTQSLYTPAQMASAITNLPSGVSVSALSVSANGTYSAPSGYAYDPVTVDVQGGGGGGNEDALVERTLSGTYENANVTQIGSCAFLYCNSLTSVNFPNVTTINTSAFASCVNLTTAIFPKVQALTGANAFFSCTKLANISFPLLESITANFVFGGLLSLTSLNFPKLARITGANVFSTCSKVSVISFPELLSASNYVFARITSLTSVYLPKATNLGIGAFSSCTKLGMVSLPKIVRMENSVFYGCTNLFSVYLLGSSRCFFGTYPAFNNVPFTTSKNGVWGSIYVRSSLWSQWVGAFPHMSSDRIVPLTDEQIAALDAQ